MPRRIAILIPIVVLACAAPAHASTTKAQRFFAAALQKDKGVGDKVKENLKNSAWRVDREILFTDLTGDGKDDAVVRVYSGTSAGDVALYVMSAGKTGKVLKVVFARENEYRLAAESRGGFLRLTNPSFAKGDPTCCPTAYTERDYKFDGGVFALRNTRRIKPGVETKPDQSAG